MPSPPQGSVTRPHALLDLLAPCTVVLPSQRILQHDLCWPCSLRPGMDHHLMPLFLSQPHCPSLSHLMPRTVWPYLYSRQAAIIGRWWLTGCSDSTWLGGGRGSQKALQESFLVSPFVKLYFNIRKFPFHPPALLAIPSVPLEGHYGNNENI